MPRDKAASNPQQEQWHHIMILTEAMFQAAQDGNWAEVEEKEKERQPLIYAFFEHDANPGRVKTVVDDIKIILTKDKQINELGEKRRKKLADILAGLRHKQRAVNAYGDNRG
jgi:hypothetical protein